MRILERAGPAFVWLRSSHSGNIRVFRVGFIHMDIKKGDTIIVRVGKNRGKKGTVGRVMPSRGLVLVNGVNLYKKHVRPKKQGEKGELVELMRPLRAPNVALFCSNCGRAARSGHRIDGTKKVRFCRRCSVAL